MVLNHGQYYSVALCKEKSSIQLDIILKQRLKNSAENRKQLIEFFETTLEKICKDLMPASCKPVSYIKCLNCDKMHLKLKNVCEGRSLHCNMEPIPLDYYQDLFRDLQGTYVNRCNDVWYADFFLPTQLSAKLNS